MQPLVPFPTPSLLHTLTHTWYILAWIVHIVMCTSFIHLTQCFLLCTHCHPLCLYITCLYSLLHNYLYLCNNPCKCKRFHYIKSPLQIKTCISSWNPRALIFNDLCHILVNFLALVFINLCPLLNNIINPLYS